MHDNIPVQHVGPSEDSLLGSWILMAAAVLGIIAANSQFSDLYDQFLEVPMIVSLGALEINKPLLLWINDGLMAIFFFVIGLELKREFIEGDLSSVNNVIFPGIGALGGMLVPAMIYAAINYEDPVAIQGWAIPAATDIAFALGALKLLGPRVPNTWKVFLTSLAIFDDVGAIIIIAIYYTSNISVGALSVVMICLPILFALNRFNVCAFKPYALIGTIMWVATLKSGVHATLAGIVLAFFIPIYSKKEPEYSLSKYLEHSLHGVVVYFVLPVFAFANGGLKLLGLEFSDLLHPVSIGITLGLFLGKQLGIFLFCWTSVKLGLASLPNNMSFKALYGIAIICGIGFTMSLFIGTLAFQDIGVVQVFDERLGIIIGSLLSGVLGIMILRNSLPRRSNIES